MKKSMLTHTFGLAVAASLLWTAPVTAQTKVGILLGFTGPIESLTPEMANSAELAMREASDSGAFLGGQKLEAVRADSTCVDAAAATAAAERLVTSEKVVGIMGADCSGVTIAVVNNVGVPNGVTMISPSATSPALSTIDDKGYFFRTAPSDARQGQVLAQVAYERGVRNVAITYTNNDYGKGLSSSFGAAFQALGGRVAAEVPHEDGKADYSAEVASLDAAGADILAVFGYVDQGGIRMMQASLDAGAFETFIFADGMVGDSLLANIDGDLSGSFGTAPGSESASAKGFISLAQSKGLDPNGPFRGESYDAAALMILAMQAAGSTDRAALASKVMSVANAPGEKIQVGELAKGLKALAAGRDIDYVGATDVEFTSAGEAAGSYKELEIGNGAFNTVRIR